MALFFLHSDTFSFKIYIFLNEKQESHVKNGPFILIFLRRSKDVNEVECA